MFLLCLECRWELQQHHVLSLLKIIRSSYLHVHDQVRGPEGSCNLLDISPPVHILKTLLVVIFFDYTYLPTHQTRNFTIPKTFTQFQASPKTTFHLIFLVANSVNWFNHCGTKIVVSGTILICACLNIFYKRALKCAGQEPFA